MYISLPKWFHSAKWKASQISNVIHYMEAYWDALASLGLRPRINYQKTSERILSIEALLWDCSTAPAEPAYVEMPPVKWSHSKTSSLKLMLHRYNNVHCIKLKYETIFSSLYEIYNTINWVWWITILSWTIRKRKMPNICLSSTLFIHHKFLGKTSFWTPHLLCIGYRLKKVALFPSTMSNLSFHWNLSQSIHTDIQTDSYFQIYIGMDKCEN